jgi:phosphorylcholine metabolism protein LicD
MSTVESLPELKVILSSPNHRHYRHIVLGKDSLCFIEDIAAFYRSLGYTDEIAKSLLPDEFIWEEYVNKSGYSLCLQKHILDYLSAHSEKFNEMYGSVYKNFVLQHESARNERGVDCVGCKLKEYCNDAEELNPQIKLPT